MSENDSSEPRRRRPGAGRKPGFSEPVVVISVSMDAETVKMINREATRAGYSRSAFIRKHVRLACVRIIDERVMREMRERGPSFDPAEDSHIKFGWDESRAGSIVPCGSCMTHIASGFVFCPSCGVEQ